MNRLDERGVGILAPQLPSGSGPALLPGPPLATMWPSLSQPRSGAWDLRRGVDVIASPPGGSIFLLQAKHTSDLGAATHVGPTPKRSRSAIPAGGLGSSTPYPTLIKDLIQRNEIDGARKLLAAALAASGDHVHLRHVGRVLAAPVVTSSNPARDYDRTAEYRWLQEHGRQFRGRWVALLNGALLSSADSLPALLEAVRREPLHGRRPLVHRVD